MSSWERKLYECDPLALAMNEVQGTFGDEISVYEKAKTLLKFGRNNDLGTDFETIWTIGGDETYVPFDGTNPIDTISSSSASDTQVMRIEGHTQSGTGTDTQFTFVVQTATLNGQNKVTLSTPLARVSRMSQDDTTPLAGDVYVYEDTAIVGGVPTDLTKAHIEVQGSVGDTQSFKAATTFSNTDYFIATNGFASVSKKQGGLVNYELQVRGPNKVFRPVSRLTLGSASQNSVQINFLPYVIIPKNYDIRVVASASAAGLEADAAFQGYIAKVI